MAKKKATKTTKTIALFIFGTILVVISLFYQAYRAEVLSFSHLPTLPSSSIKNRNPQNLPVSVEIVQINLLLPIEETMIVNGRWQIAKNAASHLAQSSSPTEKGSIIIYAHNSRDRFGSLQKVKVGETVNVKTRQGIVISYIVVQKLIVSPDQTSALDSPGKETLILYTCTGFADLKRLVIKANPL